MVRPTCAPQPKYSRDNRIPGDYQTSSKAKSIQVVNRRPPSAKPQCKAASAQPAVSLTSVKVETASGHRRPQTKPSVAPSTKELGKKSFPPVPKFTESSTPEIPRSSSVTGGGDNKESDNRDGDSEKTANENGEHESGISEAVSRTNSQTKENEVTEIRGVVPEYAGWPVNAPWLPDGSNDSREVAKCKEENQEADFMSTDGFDEYVDVKAKIEI